MHALDSDKTAHYFRHAHLNRCLFVCLVAPRVYCCLYGSPDVSNHASTRAAPAALCINRTYPKHLKKRARLPRENRRPAAA
jgi:hypothetical protein